MIEFLFFTFLGLFVAIVLVDCVVNYPLVILYFKLARNRWQMRRAIRRVCKEIELDIKKGK